MIVSNTSTIWNVVSGWVKHYFQQIWVLLLLVPFNALQPLYNSFYSSSKWIDMYSMMLRMLYLGRCTSNFTEINEFSNSILNYESNCKLICLLILCSQVYFFQFFWSGGRKLPHWTKKTPYMASQTVIRTDFVTEEAKLWLSNLWIQEIRSISVPITNLVMI